MTKIKEDLFAKEKPRPLADLLRPQSLDEIVGQDHLFGENGALAVIAKSKIIPSLVLWGPAGVGKTSIAKILAQLTGAEFVMLSAINSGVADIRKIMDNANKNLTYGEARGGGGRTILMIDEIHHFNKTQQDLFLPFIEDGTIILVATTTENPSFHLNSALLSRCKVLTLKPLDENALKKLIARAEEFTQKKLPLTDEARETLVNLACGDARYLLNACEELLGMLANKNSKADKNVSKPLKINDGDAKEDEGSRLLNSDQLLNLITKRSAQFDKKGDTHYNLISAFHKALRGSDVDASLYYLARMLVAKEDPYYILRRLAKFATEDVGMADPQALLQVMAAKDTYDFLGSPEGDFAVSYATIYCATAPKSNAAYMAHYASIKDANATTELMPPMHILNAPTKMMHDLGYHKGYIYDHDTKNCFSGQDYFPEKISKKGRPRYFEPNERGFERDIKKRIEYWDELRKKLQQDEK